MCRKHYSAALEGTRPLPRLLGSGYDGRQQPHQVAHDDETEESLMPSSCLLHVSWRDSQPAKACNTPPLHEHMVWGA